MYERILVPTDGSTGTAHVAMQAFDLATKYDAAVDILHVVEPDAGRLLGNGENNDAELQEPGRQAVATLEELAKVYDIDTTREIREGDPMEEILAAADERDVDLIVMGTHGRSGLEWRLIGSVAERIVRHADPSVLTVRLPETDRTVTDGTQAATIVTEALEADGHDEVSILGTDQQRNVWVVEAEADGVQQLVYVDPVTQRTSVIPRSNV
jgi:nucleotide-binding universal stress UspA family protein